MKVVLAARPRKKPMIPIEAETITPRHFLEGGAIKIWEGNKERQLVDLFEMTVEGEAAAVDDIEVVLQGDTSRVKRVGEYMDGGKITVEGSIGMHCGNFMTAGTIEIRGSADHWLAREMRGGTVICRGNAGHYCASGYRGEKYGMKGGSVLVHGNAGDFCAEYLTGGSVEVLGCCGDMPGVEMGGGTLTIHGDCRRACANMRGGQCTVHGTVAEMIPSFRRTGTRVLEPGGAPYTVFEGDIANRGKGTLLIKRYQYMQ
jgi:formylmethanofuran dehydrogenase subunit C